MERDQRGDEDGVSGNKQTSRRVTEPSKTRDEKRGRKDPLLSGERFGKVGRLNRLNRQNLNERERPDEHDEPSSELAAIESNNETFTRQRFILIV